MATPVNSLQTPKAPNLPISPEIPDRPYMDQLSNAHRLYYNQLDAMSSSLLGPQGGKWLRFPYAAIQRNTSKTFTANTATQITFETNDFLNGCTNDGTDGIAVENPGIYNYQFSVQLKNTDTQIHSAWIWLRINNVDVAGTGSKFDVVSSHGGTPGYIIAAANFYVELAKDDTVEMWAAASNVAISFDAIAAQTSPFPMPSIPSVVATLSFVSNIPA
jgi:hypothetical protein